MGCRTCGQTGANIRGAFSPTARAAAANISRQQNVQSNSKVAQASQTPRNAAEAAARDRQALQPAITQNNPKAGAKSAQATPPAPASATQSKSNPQRPQVAQVKRAPIKGL